MEEGYRLSLFTLSLANSPILTESSKIGVKLSQILKWFVVMINVECFSHLRNFSAIPAAKKRVYVQRSVRTQNNVLTITVLMKN